MKRFFPGLPLAVVFALISIDAPAVTINLANPSFETFDIVGNGFVDGAYLDGNIAGWTMIQPSGFYVGLQDPVDAQYPGTTGSPGTIPGGTGDQFAFVENTGSIYQDVSPVLNPGYDTLIPGVLTLTVAVGDRIDYAIGPYYIDLFAGATAIAQTNGSTEALADGVFSDIVLTYTATPSDPNLGQPLRIRLGSDPVLTGAPSQVNYDNVRLTWEIPEPSTSVLAVLGLLALRRKYFSMKDC